MTRPDDSASMHVDDETALSDLHTKVNSLLTEIVELVGLRLGDIPDQAVREGSACAALCAALVSFSMEGKGMAKDAVIAAVSSTIDRYVEHRMKGAS